MKKAVWIILAVVLVLIIVGGIYYFNKPIMDNSNPNKPQCGAIGSRSEGWYSSDGLIKWDNCKGCEAVCRNINTVNEGWYNSCNGELILEMKCSEQTLVGGCAGVQNIHWQECCENWAQENHIVHIMCVGSWTVENNVCTWKCGG